MKIIYKKTFYENYLIRKHFMKIIWSENISWKLFQLTIVSVQVQLAVLVEGGQCGAVGHVVLDHGAGLVAPQHGHVSSGAGVGGGGHHDVADVTDATRAVTDWSRASWPGVASISSMFITVVTRVISVNIVDTRSSADAALVAVTPTQLLPRHVTGISNLG